MCNGLGAHGLYGQVSSLNIVQDDETWLCFFVYALCYNIPRFTGEYLLLLCQVQFLQYHHAKCMAGKNVSKMTYFWVRWDVKPLLDSVCCFRLTELIATWRCCAAFGMSLAAVFFICMVRQCNGWSVGLAISRLQVQILLEATLRNNLRQVVRTYVPLLPSSITWYRPKGGDALRLGR